MNFSAEKQRIVNIEFSIKNLFEFLRDYEILECIRKDCQHHLPDHSIEHSKPLSQLYDQIINGIHYCSHKLLGDSILPHRIDLSKLESSSTVLLHLCEDYLIASGHSIVIPLVAGSSSELIELGKRYQQECIYVFKDLLDNLRLIYGPPVP